MADSYILISLYSHEPADIVSLRVGDLVELSISIAGFVSGKEGKYISSIVLCGVTLIKPNFMKVSVIQAH